MKRASEGCRKQSAITRCRKEEKDVARWLLNEIHKWKQRDFRVYEIKNRFKCSTVVEKRLLELLHSIDAALWTFGLPLCKKIAFWNGMRPSI